MQRILIVRMSALGDIVHALPVLSALRAAYPAAEIDWLVDARYARIFDFVSGLTTRIIGRPRLLRATAELRRRAYDVAIDLQGLLKSASMARFSGARRVVGFERAALREAAAAWLHTEAVAIGDARHVIRKNLSVLPALGVPAPREIAFPLVVPESPVAREIAGQASRAGFALINPGAGWPNKQWAPDRFGRLAATMAARHGLTNVVLWAPGEEHLADAVVAAAMGAAVRAPATSLGDLLALCQHARLMVAGDTGPLHLAAALGTPLVGLFGPTWPDRNGPWRPDDEVVSRAGQCGCHHKRTCQRDGPSDGVESRMCLNDIGVDEVAEAVDRRLARVPSS